MDTWMLGIYMYVFYSDIYIIFLSGVDLSLNHGFKNLSTVMRPYIEVEAIYCLQGLEATVADSQPGAKSHVNTPKNSNNIPPAISRHQHKRVE